MEKEQVEVGENHSILSQIMESFVLALCNHIHVLIRGLRPEWGTKSPLNSYISLNLLPPFGAQNFE